MNVVFASPGPLPVPDLASVAPVHAASALQAAAQALFGSKRELEIVRQRSSRSLLANVIDIDDSEDQATPATVRGCFDRELTAILRELRYITGRMKREDRTGDIIAEWKYAAVVVDRVCLILFTAFTVLSTCICLFSAPTSWPSQGLRSADGNVT
ncbi:neur_chan_memb domain-containing protein [Caerostris extrusa]|uniref:Neur_chan_memb domain-containing protein n=1 Tax=Caerostris extrusa TaxID=172846 RepID=A0AAV4YCW3_CAEEX|nr:neur_chan_memb domain-containing protein [Caerostris extrusa]